MSISTLSDDSTGYGTRNVRRRIGDIIRPALVSIASQATGFSQQSVDNAFDTMMDVSSVGVQQAILNQAKRTVDQMTGAGEQDIDRDNINMPLCSIIPGRGAEVGIAGKGFQGGSKLKLPAGNAKLHNAFAEQIKAWEPVTAKMSFAYKGLLDVSLKTDITSPATRFYTHQFFRHCSLTINNSSHNETTLDWNKTLGPDNSYIRKVPPSGTAYSVPGGGNTGLKSAYRYPQQGKEQVVRMSRVILENIGWNANPYKYVTCNTTSTSLTGTLTTTTPMVYANADIYSQDSATNQPRSHANLQPKDMTAESTPANSTSCYYRSQFGTGLVNYQFCNDGTTPVVVDIVVTKCRKGQFFSTPSTYVSTLESSWKQGYLNMCSGNRGVADFQGNSIRSADIFDDSKTEFMPKKCLTYMNEANRPFQFVVRDQFIVDAGSVKPYEFKMPALNYYSPDYAQSNEFVDDLTYCVSVAFSTLSIPIIETLTTGSAIIDRRGNSLNMSVTGTYTERIHPVYLSEYNNNWYVNGALTVPIYVDGSVPTVARSTIIPPETAQRGSTTASAYIVQGPSNTQSGA
ncbi:hypothetical protein [Circoviridae sp.]|nr:hypothetical protein [Circoviridae sp.]